LETVNLLDNKQFSLFGLNILGNVALSFGAVILGRISTLTILRL
jgi:fluoride ion exporter CrcB/FEX